MSELPCIYDMSMIQEKDALDEDILNGKALEVLISLLYSSKSAKEISDEIGSPPFTVKLYLKRLMNHNLVKKTSSHIVDGRLIEKFELASHDIDILNNLKKQGKAVNAEQKLDLSAKHFAHLTQNTIQNLKSYQDKPYKIKAYFIKAKEEDMVTFKKELDELFEKYQALEDDQSDSTYSLINVFAPFST